MRDTRTSQQKVSVRYLRGENDWRRILMDTKGVNSSDVTSEGRCAAENRWIFIAEERMGFILSPSALCIFKAAVKHLTVNNMFTKKALAGLCLQWVFHDISLWCRLVTSSSQQQEWCLYWQLKILYCSFSLACCRWSTAGAMTVLPQGAGLPLGTLEPAQVCWIGLWKRLVRDLQNPLVTN